MQELTQGPQTQQAMQETQPRLFDVRAAIADLERRRGPSGPNHYLEIAQNSNTYGQENISLIKRALLLRVPVIIPQPDGGSTRHYLIPTDAGLRAITVRVPSKETIEQWQKNGENDKLANFDHAVKAITALQQEHARCLNLPEAKKTLQGIQYRAYNDRTSDGATVRTEAVTIGPPGRPDFTIINGDPGDKGFVFVNTNPPIELYDQAVEANFPKPVKPPVAMTA